MVLRILRIPKTEIMEPIPLDVGIKKKGDIMDTPLNEFVKSEVKDEM